jgi:hypothetical protein
MLGDGASLCFCEAWDSWGYTQSPGWGRAVLFPRLAHSFTQGRGTGSRDLTRGSGQP